MAMRELLQYTTWAMLTLLILAGSTGPSSLFGQEPEILVQVDRNKVFEGESLTYGILLNLVDNPTRPDLSHLTDFAVEPAGEKELNSQSITIINGVRTEVVQKGTQYLYRLTPKSSGDLIIPAPTVIVGGKSIEGKSIKIQVKALEAQDLVKLEMSVDRPTVYLAQEFTLKLKVFVKSLPDPNSDQDPLSIQRDPPSLTISWLGEDLPDSLTAKQPIGEALQKLVSQRGTGFGINGYREHSVFSMFDQNSLAFHPRPKVVQNKDASDNEVTYWTYEFSRTFSATKPGQFQFIPVTLKGTFGKTINRGRLLGEDVFAKSNAVEVQVLDAPLDGRPDSYIGAIGTFTVVSELSPTSARVGDPLTLSISLNGKGLLSDAQPPKLDSVAAISSGFRVYEGTTQTDERGKRFTYSLRPLSSSVKQLPEIPVSYFDVQQEKYVTLKTQPIDITVSEAERLDAASVLSSATGTSFTNSKLTQIAGGMVGNYTDLSSLSDDRYSPSFFVVVWIAMFGLALIAHGWIGFTKKRNANPQLNRQRTALTRARTLLSDAEKMRTDKSSNHGSAQTIDMLRRALVGLVADYANVSAEGLSIGDVDAKLAQYGATDELRSQVRSFLDACDAARFGAAGNDVTSMHNQAESLVSRIDQALTEKSTKALLVLLSCLLLSGCGPVVSEQANKAFAEATQQFEAAQTEKDFFKVALRYQQILEGGYVCGPILFNQGNAWLKAGETGRAIACYRRALRYRPRDTLVQTNLAHAQSLIPNLPQAKGKAAFEYVYFWRDWLSLNEKLYLETVLIGLVLLSSILAWRWSKCRGVAAALLIGAMLFGVACWLDYRDQFANQHGVVVSHPATARKGNGDGFDPAFSGELPEGSEFTVVDRKRDWLQIEVAGLGRGWLREESVLLY